MDPTSATQSSWQTFLTVYLRPAVLKLFLLGFSAGIPLMLVFSTLSFWLREAGVERASIGFFSWVTLAYAGKWLWAPAIDKVSLPYLTNRLGRRRSWLLVSQIGVIAAILAMTTIDPAVNLKAMAIAAVGIAFFSASQDIVIDAFRIESGSESEQAAMAASYMVGYRIAMIVATAGSFFIADAVQVGTEYDPNSWSVAYITMAMLMLVGVFTTLFSREPTQVAIEPATVNQPISAKLYDAAVMPVIDMVQRYKWHAILLLLLVCSYRISDVVMGVMANVFYVDMGYSKTEIATLSKVYGVVMTLVGAVFAGSLINRYGTLKILLVGAILSAVTNLLFVVLSHVGHNLTLLAAVISIDNLSAGIAMAALIAFMSSLTQKQFTATQYAWLSSVMVLLPKFIGGFSGDWVDAMGYSQFFTMTAVIGIPAMVAILVLLKQKWHA